MVYGTVKAYQVINPATGKHFGGSAAEIPFLSGRNGYIALTAFVLNLLIAVVGTVVLRALRAPAGTDVTEPADYWADAGDPRVAPLPEAYAAMEAHPDRAGVTDSPG